MFCIRKCSHNRKTNFKGGIKMKKFFAMMMCAIMLFGLVACGDGDPEATFPSGGVFTTRPVETETMSRDDAVEAVERYYENVTRRAGKYSHLIDPNSVLDDGAPVISVFVVDNCGEMTAEQLRKLHLAIYATSGVIRNDEYVGLVLYDNNPHVEFPVTRLTDDSKREYSRLSTSLLNEFGDSGSAMFDATVVGLKMLIDAQEYAPSATLRLVLVSNGRLDTSYNIDKIENVVPLATGLNVQIYTVAYTVAESDYRRLESLKKLAEDTGAKCIEVDGMESDIRGALADLAREVCNR